jgi:GMP reductase
MINQMEMGYKDINLIPRKCIVDSRQECDTSVVFGNRTFSMPVYPANMKSVVDENTCEFLAKNNWFYTMHRFGVDQVRFIKMMHKQKLFASISIGVNGDSQEELENILDSEDIPEYITIDVANAWSEKVRQKIEWIKKYMPNVFLIVGNIATKEAAKDLQNFGVSAIKVGIAGGKVCISKNKTGFFRPMVSALEDCRSVSVPIIADGGIEQHGDIARALVCGATMVMAGYLFCGYSESAGEVIEIDDRQYKQYYGSASKYNKEQQKNIEGRKILIPYRGSMEHLLKEMHEDLQSSISYGGGKSLEVFKEVEYKVILN